jgi:CysZ protein
VLALPYLQNRAGTQEDKMLSYFKGADDCIAGFKLILNPGLRRFVIVPLVINIALFGTVIYFLSKKIDSWVTHLLPSWLSFLEFILWPLFAITIFLIVFYSFTMLANLIAAPFNSLLAARVEAMLGHQAGEEMSSDAIWKVALRSIGSELVKTIYFIKWLIPLLILTFIPGLNIIAPAAWFIYAAWSYALEYTDYPLGNHEQLFPAVREYNRKNRMRALGFGSVVFLMTSIPFLNFLAMPVAVCGATQLTVKIKKQNHA